MSLKLHQHPLSSYCQKAIIALYENGAPFEAAHLDLGAETARSGFLALWPIGRMPVLQDEARGEVVPETSIIIEYLDLHYPGAAPLIPADRHQALQARLMDRIFDHYVQTPMQAIVADRIRPDGKSDPAAVEGFRAQLRTTYDVLEKMLAGRAWAAGEDFSLADCAAAPALFYAGALEPFAVSHPTLAAYYERLKARPSVARAFAEAKPFHAMFPGDELAA